nr:hypothetical protein [Tanacetum cinerariifolium]
MDTSWMSLSRVTSEYEKGLEKYLDFMFACESDSKHILCPCVICRNGIWVDQKEASDHLICDRFIKGYQIPRSMSRSTTCPVLDTQDDMQLDTQDDMQGLVRDAFRISNESTLSHKTCKKDDKNKAASMRWHDEGHNKDGCLRYPAVSPAWKTFYFKYHDFAKEPRNVQIGLASDGFNPFGNMSNSHSTSSGNFIDVYLEPLVKELKELCDDGVETYDASTKTKFEMHASLLLTISDFPAYTNLSGWSTKEAKIGGPIHYRWMYPIERYLSTLKSYVRNKSRPEGSIAEGYIVEECPLFCSLYLSPDVETEHNRISRNYDDGGSVDVLPIFLMPGHQVRETTTKVLDLETLSKAHSYVLFNCSKVDEFIKRKKEDENGFTLLNFKGLKPHNEPFILASQAQHMFYVVDPVDKGWKVVIKPTTMDSFDMTEPTCDDDAETYLQSNTSSGPSHDESIDISLNREGVSGTTVDENTLVIDGDENQF